MSAYRPAQEHKRDESLGSLFYFSHYGFTLSLAIEQ